ncbi:MAG: DoxX protein [Bacteroidetes bacterium]|nr:DoxX protein [Bacteroidota bacterium]
MKVNKALFENIGRIIIGIVFILSALFKYLSIENVDLFFFEHGVFNWVFTTFVSRFLIAIETILGLMLIFRIYPKVSYLLSLLFLSFFSLYIILKPYLFDVSTENCFCFGDVLVFNDIQTLIKNIILILIVLFLIPRKGKKNRYSKVLLILFSITSIGAVYSINPPDIIKAKIFNNSVSINYKAFEDLSNLNNVKELKINEGKKVICLYSTGCKYCKFAAKKISIIITNNNLHKDSFIEIFWGNRKNVDSFHKEANIDSISYTFVPAPLFLEATKNKQPIIILLNNGKIEKLYKLTTIDERYIVSFLTNK